MNTITSDPSNPGVLIYPPQESNTANINQIDFISTEASAGLKPKIEVVYIDPIKFKSTDPFTLGAINRIPSELFWEISSHLENKTLRVILRVSKRWYILTQSYMHRYKIKSPQWIFFNILKNVVRIPPKEYEKMTKSNCKTEFTKSKPVMQYKEYEIWEMRCYISKLPDCIKNQRHAYVIDQIIQCLEKLPISGIAKFSKLITTTYRQHYIYKKIDKLKEAKDLLNDNDSINPGVQKKIEKIYEEVRVGLRDYRYSPKTHYKDPSTRHLVEASRWLNLVHKPSLGAIIAQLPFTLWSYNFNTDDD